MSDDNEKLSQDDKLEALGRKLDRVLAAVETVSNQVIKMDQNVIVVAGRVDAIEPEVTQIKPAIAQLERALVHVAGDVQDIRQRLFEEADRTDRRLKVLEPLPNGNGSHG